MDVGVNRVLGGNCESVYPTEWSRQTLCAVPLVLVLVSGSHGAPTYIFASPGILGSRAAWLQCTNDNRYLSSLENSRNFGIFNKERRLCLCQPLISKRVQVGRSEEGPELIFPILDMHFSQLRNASEHNKELCLPTQGTSKSYIKREAASGAFKVYGGSEVRQFKVI